MLMLCACSLITSEVHVTKKKNATVQQLEARWDTAEGALLARNLRSLFSSSSAHIDELRQLISDLPFREEVDPFLDFRGLHLPEEDVTLNRTFFLSQLSIPGTHFEYLQSVNNLINCNLQEAIFDEMHTINSTFGSDFRRASFRKAMLQGVRFWYADLREATFFQARLAKADFSDVPCQGASFVEADMRFTLCAGTDFRGADLRRANLTDSSLGGVLFDDQTRLQGTILRGASIDDSFRSYAEKAGAILGTEEEKFYAYNIACFDALSAIIRDPIYNPDHRFNVVLPLLAELRVKLVQNHWYLWGNELVDSLEGVLSPEDINTLGNELYADAMRLLAYYL